VFINRLQCHAALYKSKSFTTIERETARPRMHYFKREDYETQDGHPWNGETQYLL
jgi:hypothetical protein